MVSTKWTANILGLLNMIFISVKKWCLYFDSKFTCIEKYMLDLYKKKYMLEKFGLLIGFSVLVAGGGHLKQE